MVKIHRVSLNPVRQAEGDDYIYIEDAVRVEVEFWKDDAETDIQLLLLLYDVMNNPIFYSVSFYSGNAKVSLISLFKNQTGLFKMSCIIPPNFMNHGTYRMQLRFGNGTTNEAYIHNKFFQFEIHENPNIKYYNIRDLNVPLRPQFEWAYERMHE